LGANSDYININLDLDSFNSENIEDEIVRIFLKENFNESNINSFLDYLSNKKTLIILNNYNSKRDKALDNTRIFQRLSNNLNWKVIISGNRKNKHFKSLEKKFKSSYMSNNLSAILNKSTLTDEINSN
jgi:hypothetical protein